MTSAARCRGACAVLGLLAGALASGAEEWCAPEAAGRSDSSVLLARRSRSSSSAEVEGLQEDEDHDEEGATPWSAMVIIDSNYIPVFDCWWSAFVRSGSRTPLRLGGLDEGASEALRSKLQPALLEGAGDPLVEVIDLQPRPGLSLLQSAGSPPSFLTTFWKAMRTSIVSSPGGSLHCDADALWVRSPDRMIRQALRAHPEADIVAQASFGAKSTRSSKKWGFVINTGFTLFRKTPGVLAMVDSFLAANQTHFEQGVLNNYLLTLGCQWNQTHDKHSTTLTVGRCGNLTVLLLPASRVSRVWHTEQQLTIYHADIHHLTSLPELRGMGLC